MQNKDQNYFSVDPKYTVAEDSKDRLVLETKGSRFVNLGCFSFIGGFFLLAFFLVKEGLIFDILFALGAAFGFGTAIFAFFDTERWVFEESSKILTYTSRLRPWKNLAIKASQVERAEIERDVKEFTSSRHSHSGFGSYREKTYYRDVYTLYLIMKDGRRIKVSRDGDTGYQRNLSSRMTGRTAETIDMVEVKQKIKQKAKEKGREKPSEEKEEEPVYKGQTLSHWMEWLNSQDPRRKVEAIIAVGMIGQKAWKAEPALIEALKDQDEDIRWLAAQHLGSIDPGEGAVQALLDVLKNNQEGTRVRASAAYSLGRIREDVRAAVPILSEALSSEDALLCVSAAGSLIKIDPSLNKESLKVLLDGLKDSRSFVRNSAILALSRMGTGAKEAVPELAKALKDEDKWCRLAAAHALEGMGLDAKEAVPALYEALKDEDERLRKAARSALDKIQKG
jgi:HEAT repeat protein